MSSSTQQSTPKLPMLTAHGKGNEVLFQAYVNSYVIGTRGGRMNGRWAYPLYWISLVGMRGQGTLLQGIFARLVANTPRQVTLSDLSDVQLAHHHPHLQDLGYTLHWNFEQAEIQPQKDLHAVIESRMLTCIDPIRGSAALKRGKSPTTTPGAVTQSKREGKGGKSGGQSGRASLSTVKGSAAQLGASELQARERSPLFLLFAQGDDPEPRAASHLAFLDQRVPWPLLPEWAEFLWERGIETGEIEPLTVWNATTTTNQDTVGSPGENTPGEDDEEEGDAAAALSTSSLASVRPLFTEAYLCRPRPEKLLTDLQRSLRSGHSLLPHSFPHVTTTTEVREEEEGEEGEERDEMVRIGQETRHFEEVPI